LEVRSTAGDEKQLPATFSLVLIKCLLRVQTV